MKIEITKEDYKEQAELLYDRVAATEYCKGVNDGKAIAIKRIIELIDAANTADGVTEEAFRALEDLKATIVGEAIK